MYRHILAATDGSELASKALHHAAHLAKGLGAKLTIVTVTEPWPVLATAQRAQERKADPIGQFEAEANAWAQTVLGNAKAEANAQGVACETLHIADQRPADGILQAAQACGCDAIVMATHGRRGLRRMMLGSQAADVVAEASVPVIIVK